MADIQAIRSAMRGDVFTPGDEQYDAVRRPWNLSVDQHPALVVMAESADDVRAAVTLARERELPLAVQSSGHGAVHPCDGGVVVNVTRMAGVSVDGSRHVARIDAGARWRAALEAAEPYGLAGLSGTAPTVGAVGYTLGGGLGLLLRRFGFAADSVLAADVVTAAGESVRADETENPDLLWALKGGSGNFGVVTALEVRLYPVQQVHNGMIAYPGERAAEVLGAWASWTGQVSDDVTSAALVMTIPPVPTVPEVLRGRQIVAVRATVAGGGSADVDRLRTGLGEPLMDTFGSSSYLQAALSGMEPEDPMPSAGRSVLVAELSTAAIDTIVASLAEPGSAGVGIEIRHLGGAAARAPERPSAVSNRDAEYVVAAHAAPATPDEEAAVTKHLDDGFTALEPYRRPGAFVNFLPAGTTPDVVRTAYSDETYRRLQQVKHAYDPDNVFRLNHNIPPAAGAAREATHVER